MPQHCSQRLLPEYRSRDDTNLANNNNSNVPSTRYPEPTNGERRAYQDMKRDQLTNLHGFQSDAEFGMFVRQYMDKAFMTNAAEIASKSYGRISNLGNLIAMYSPSWLGPNNPTRQLRDWLRDAQLTGQHLLSTTEFWAKNMGEAAARFQFTATIREAHADFLNIAGSRNLSKPVLDALWADMVELGQKSRLVQFNGSNEFTYKKMKRKHTALIERARGLGFSDDEISQMVEASARHASVMDATRGVVNVANVELDATPGIGYMHRALTDDASFLLRNARLAEIGLDGANVRYSAAASSVLISRETFDFVVDDVLLYAEAIGVPLSTKNAKKAREAYARVSRAADAYAEKVATRPPGRTNAQQAAMEARYEKMVTEAADRRAGLHVAEREATAAVAAHFTDDRTLLHDFLEVIDPKTLDRLVDNGVIGKAPIESTRLFQVLKDRYNLPFDGLADFIETDPLRSFELYRNKLSVAMGTSQMISEMHVNGVAFGFAVTPQTYRANRAAYRGYRPLSQIMQNHGVPITEANKLASQTMVSPFAFDQMDALLKASTEPAVLGTVGRVWRDFTDWFKTSVLATPEFVFRNMTEVTLQTWRAGTNLARLPMAMQYYRDFMRFGPESLPTDKIFAGNTLSVRDIVERLVSSGRLNMGSPIEGVSVAGAVRTETERAAAMLGYRHDPNAALNLRNFVPFMQRLAAVATHQGLVDGVKFGLTNMSKAQQRLFFNMVKPLAWFEDAAIIANLMSTLDNSAMGRVGQFFSTTTTPYFDNIDEAMRHVDEYLYRYQTGVADSVIKQYVPFWSYMSNAMPAAFRGIMREPGQYMAYQRLYAAINGDAREDEDFTQAATPAHFGQQMPIVFRDPAGREGMWFSVDMSRFDPVADLTRRLGGISDLVGRARGHHTGRFNDEIAQARGLTDRDFFARLAQNLGPLEQTAIAAITQRHPFFGTEFQQQDEILGVTLNGQGALSGGFQRYMLDTWVPQLRWVEKQARLQGFGPGTTEVGPDGELRTRPEVENLMLRFMNAVGFTTTTMDLVRGLQNTEISMRSLQSDIREQRARLNSRALSEQNPEKRLEMMREIEVLNALEQQVAIVEEDVNRELKENGNLTYNERREVIRERSDANLEQFQRLQSEINR